MTERLVSKLHVALLSYDEREIRVRKNYLEEQNPAICCVCFHSGEELLRELRQRYGLPVIVVSARTEESEKVAALDSGADDYITKPFGSPELLARIRAALRRAGPAANLSAFTTGELTIDYDKHLVTLAGQPVHLTANEYRLVELLSRSAGKVLTYDRISDAMWGDAAGGNSQLLRVNMANIRRKLEQNPAEPQYILTEIGVGYRMKEPG